MVRYVKKNLNTTKMYKKKAKAIVSMPVRKYVAKAIQKKAETKFVGTQALEESVSSAVACVVHSDISQVAGGSANTERVGDKIQSYGVWLSYILHNNGSVPVYVRVIMIECNDGDFTATSSLFLEDANGDPQALTAERLSDINFTLNKHKFKVLYDKHHRIAGLGDGTGIETIQRRKLIKLKGNRMFVDATSADSKNKNIRLITIARSADNDSTAQVVEMTYSTKYYFKDY